jgi:hypothetical protein
MKTSTVHPMFLFRLIVCSTLGALLAVNAIADEAPKVSWNTHSDTWVATDALGRALPTSDEAGALCPNKTVGIFYFLWLGRHGEQGPFDISKILTADPMAMQNPASELWGPMYVPHHWGESLFGYYVSDDDSVLRKHAQMLSDAGIDMVVFDVTNQFTYPESWQALCRVWDESRRAGNRVPQIAFLCPFGDPRKVVQDLWDQLYGRSLYEELWFRWEGKPLILADPSRIPYGLTYERHDIPAELKPGMTLGQAFAATEPFHSVGGSFPTWATTDAAVTLSLYREGPNGERVASQRFQNVVDNAWLMLDLKTHQAPGKYYLEASAPRGKIGWWSTSKEIVPNGQALADRASREGDRSLRIVPSNDRNDEVRDFFTFRKPQPDYFVGPTGPEQWGWLEVTPQHAFYKTPGVPEQVTVGVGQNAVDGKLGVLSNPRAYGRSFHNGNEPAPEDCDTTGRNFAEQWDRAMEIDPPFVFVTGWNEWIAGRFDKDAPFQGAGPVSFVDQFNQEFSRDCEPMKDGHGDNYYYQLASHVRRFKGARPIPPVTPRPISIDGQFDDWKEVQPEFRDTIGDPVRRDYRGWDPNVRYVNRTGRNDIVEAKISFDEHNVYFYVRTREKLSPSGDPNWMLLLIDSDSDTETGWLGYDRILNRKPPQNGTAVLEENVGGNYSWGTSKDVAVQIRENELELAVPRKALGINGDPAALDFKWADNIQQTGQWSDFTVNGDAAPNDRFNYRARLDLSSR